MTREEYIEKVKQIMIIKNSAGNIHERNFNTYNYGEMSPINGNIVRTIRNGKVILNENVYQSLLNCQKVTHETKEECMFLLYGKQMGYDQIKFDEFILVCSNESHVALFNNGVVKHLWDEIKKDSDHKPVICLGHTNSYSRDFQENFTLGDFTDYMQIFEDNSFLKKYQIEITGCILTESGDMNFILLDSINKNFYAFIYTFVQRNNKQMPLSCFNPKEQVKKYLRSQN